MPRRLGNPFSDHDDDDYDFAATDDGDRAVGQDIRTNVATPTGHQQHEA
jgi:hypothetical protein